MSAGLVPLRLTASVQTAGMGFTLQPMKSQIAPGAKSDTDTVTKALATNPSAVYVIT
jgi:hypothetical protein